MTEDKKKGFRLTLADAPLLIALSFSLGYLSGVISRLLGAVWIGTFH